MYKIIEEVDVKKVVKDLQKNFSGSNEEQMAGVQLLKGLATSDEAIANEFMKKLDTVVTQVSKEVLGDKKEEKLTEGELNAREKEQVNAAVKVLKSRDPMGDMTGGITRADARSFLLSTGYTWEEINKLEGKNQKEESSIITLENDIRIGDKIIEAGERIQIMIKEKKIEELNPARKNALEKELKNLFKQFRYVKVIWNIDSIEIVMPSADWYWNEFSKLGGLEKFDRLVDFYNIDYDLVDNVIVIFI
jgi:hypothetical protein